MRLSAARKHSFPGRQPLRALPSIIHGSHSLIAIARLHPSASASVNPFLDGLIAFLAYLQCLPVGLRPAVEQFDSRAGTDGTGSSPARRHLPQRFSPFIFRHAPTHLPFLMLRARTPRNRFLYGYDLQAPNMPQEFGGAHFSHRIGPRHGMIKEKAC